MKDFFEFREAYRKSEEKSLDEQFVVKYAKNKRGPIYQTKFSSQGEAEKFLAQKKKEGMNGIVSKAGKPVSMQKMKDLQKESVELGESVDFMKMSKELWKHKSKGIEFEKAAAYVRAIHNNSNVNVQDKAFMGLIKMLKDMDDFTKRTTITKILKDNGFKVRGGKLMREEVELDESKTVKVSRADFDKLKKGSVIDVDWDGAMSAGAAALKVVSKSRSAKYDVEKIKLMPTSGGGRSAPFYLYSRKGGDATLAIGDMGASMTKYKIVKESVEMNEKASDDEIMKDINDFLRNNDGSGVAGMSRRLEKKYGIGPARARSMIKTALQKAKALPKTGPKKMGRFPHMKESVELEEAVAKVKTTMPDKVASGAQRFGLKATTKGGHVSISGSKGKLNDFMRAIIGRSSYGNASDITESAENTLTEKTTIDLAREVVKTKGAKHGLDMQSANLILKVYDKVNDKNKKKMETMSPSALGKAVWKIYAKMQDK